jgi:hypothetical protein
MDVAQFKACVTCAATIDRDQVPSLSTSNGFTYPLFTYSNTNPNLITFLTLILGTKTHQSLFIKSKKDLNMYIYFPILNYENFLIMSLFCKLVSNVRQDKYHIYLNGRQCFS